MSQTGVFRDPQGNKIWPESVAERILVQAEDGTTRLLADVLAELGVAQAIIHEQSVTLQGALEPDDLYLVPSYMVGAGRIQLWLDGAYSSLQDGLWQEYGRAGELSDYILITGQVPVGTVVTVRVGERVETRAVTLSDAVDSDSSLEAATSFAVKTAYDESVKMDATVLAAGAELPKSLRRSGLYFEVTADGAGIFRDGAGSPLHPATTAGQVAVTTESGTSQPLSAVLQDVGISPTEIFEEDRVLAAPLEAGDLYTVPAYLVGGRRIQIWLDGIYATGGADGVWQESGTEGQTSDLLQINGTIEAGTVITVRVRN